MPLYELTANNFRPVAQTSFAELNIRERDDLQRLLRAQIEVLGDDLYVLAEEFAEWEDSRLRIDLLAIDKQANLVVIELKRTVDGGHMELQAIRYASMVSAMTFERAVQINGVFLERLGQSADEARHRILEFLNWEEPDDEEFAGDVRIILVAQDFGKELTTAVLWLRERDIDIRCIRLRPYGDGDRRLVDVQQIIPLAEAQEYQVQLKQKEQSGRKMRAERYDIRLRFWQGLMTNARVQKTRHANIKPNSTTWMSASSGFSGLSFAYVAVQEYALVELYVDRRDTDENKRVFDSLYARRDEIEKAFGNPLSWERLDAKRACRLYYRIDSGGYRSPESEWPRIYDAMIRAMTRLEAALLPALASLGL